MKRTLLSALPHVCIALSLAALTVCVVDGINTQMGFLASTWGRVLLICASACSLLLAVRDVRNGS